MMAKRWYLTRPGEPWLGHGPATARRARAPLSTIREHAVRGDGRGGRRLRSLRNTLRTR